MAEIPHPSISARKSDWTTCPVHPSACRSPALPPRRQSLVAIVPPVWAPVVRRVQLERHPHHEPVAVIAILRAAVEIDALQASGKPVGPGFEAIASALVFVGGALLLGRQCLAR